MYTKSHVVFVTILTTIQAVHSVTVRLQGGSEPHEGRLEVYVDGRWGTVADTSFGLIEAAVVCRQLGFPGLALATNSAVFGKGSGAIAYNDIDCGKSGDRPAHIGECLLHPPESSSDHSNDVGVVCNVTSPPSIRLVGGSGHHEGRLEVLFRGQWGSVCDPNPPYDLGINNANTVCRHLGFTGVSMVPASSTDLGIREGPILLSELICDRSDGYLHECVRQWGSLNSKCDEHANDVAIICNASVPSSDIRLVGGSGPHEGRVEIRHNGQWGTVCGISGSWKPQSYFYEDGSSSSKTICQQLGFSNGQSYDTSSKVFGSGTGWRWIDVFFCPGTHDFPCIYYAFGGAEVKVSDYCDHSNDVGVICNVMSPPPVRLVDGFKPNEGRVEIKFSEEWGTICDGWISFDDGTTICRHLGYSGVNDNWTAGETMDFGNGSLERIWLSSITCREDSARIDLCFHDSLGTSYCNLTGHHSAVGIACEASSPAAPIRLVGGSDLHEGRLEIFHDGEWGTICVEDYQKWGRAEADVVCRQLGYPPDDTLLRSGPSQATMADIFGGVLQEKIWLDSVKCDFTQKKSVLKECEHKEWGGNDVCDHTNDVGVICGVTTPLPPLVRLVGGSSPYEGRLEIFFQGEWGTVCHEKDWTYDKLPETVCKQMGLVDGASELSRVFGQGEGRIWLEKVRCNGNESGIDSCQHPPWGGVMCDHSMDIGVECNVIQSGRYFSTRVVVVLGITLVLIIITLILVVILKRRYRNKAENTDSAQMVTK